MVAKIYINALKIKKKSRTNEAENRQELQTASINSRVTGSKKNSVLRFA